MTDAVQYFREYLERVHIEQLQAQVDRAAQEAHDAAQGHGPQLAFAQH